jgi:hypothetical protein
VFGRGLTSDAGRYELTPASTARVRAAADYVTAHEADFARAMAAGRPRRIVFSGGWPEASQGAAAPPPGSREGDLMLASAGHLASLADLRAEGESRSTLENLVNSAPLLDGVVFSAAEPLGIVAHPGHLRRVRYLARKVLGLRDEQILDVPARESVDGASRLTERAAEVVSRLSFLGADDPATLVTRERRTVATLRRVERLRAALTSRKSPGNGE